MANRIIRTGNPDISRWGGTALTGRDISADLKALIDDSIKGVMRSIGDPGAAPENVAGYTTLYWLSVIRNAALEPGTAFGKPQTSGTFLAETFSTTTLAANATYTGASKDFRQPTALGFALALAYADVAGTIYWEQSIDGSNWDYSESQAVSAGAGNKLKSAIYARYIRPKYVNGAAAQATFRFGGRYVVA